jgi:hypothetical protein
LLITEYGYTRKTEAKNKDKGNGKDEGGGGYDWNKFGDLLDHDNLCSVAMALIKGGLDKDATYNMLRTRAEAIETPDIERKQRRLAELRGIVDSATAKTGKASKTPETPRIRESYPTVADWLKRELPEPEPLLGHWLVAGSRVLMFSDT